MISPGALTPEERAALDALVPPAEQTGDLANDLAEAARESMRRRVENSRNGGAVLGALHRYAGTWRRVQDLTGIPFSSARRWAKAPKGSS